MLCVFGLDLDFSLVRQAVGADGHNLFSRIESSLDLNFVSLPDPGLNFTADGAAIRANNHDFGKMEREIFLSEGLDSLNRLESAGEISTLARAIFQLSAPRAGRRLDSLG